MELEISDNRMKRFVSNIVIVCNIAVMLDIWAISKGVERDWKIHKRDEPTQRQVDP